MKKILFLFISITISYNTYSQSGGTLVKADQEIDDFKAIVGAYIGPLGNSLGAGLNNGWYNTAKPHKLGGFDVTITANFVLINKDVKTFIIDDVIKDAESSIFGGGEVPTIVGNSNGNITFDNTDYKMLDGLNIPVIPLPILQAGVGLIKGTELTIRYIPELKIGNAGKVGLIGVGIKHDLLQWLPIVDKIPIDISIQAGYTKLESVVELIDPNEWVEPTEATLGVYATTINLLLSKKLLMFTPYIGLGYNSSKTTFSATGKYTLGNAYVPVDIIKDGFEFESKNNLRTNIGFRFNIAVIALQANYTFSEYPTATLGIGISVR